MSFVDKYECAFYVHHRVGGCKRDVKRSGDFALYRSILSLSSSGDDTLVFPPSIFRLSRPPSSLSLRSEKVSRDAISPRGHSFSSELSNEPYQSRATIFFFFFTSKMKRAGYVRTSFVYKRLN